MEDAIRAGGHGNAEMDEQAGELSNTLDLFVPWRLDKEL
jgi:hypothetical protein